MVGVHIGRIIIRTDFTIRGKAKQSGAERFSREKERDKRECIGNWQSIAGALIDRSVFFSSSLVVC